MRDELLGQLADRIREFHRSRAPGAVLDEAGPTVARRLLALLDPAPTGPADVDADILHTVASYYWARALAQDSPEASAAELDTAVTVFGMLFLADHRRVPRELWPRLTAETGRDPWRDPVDHAGDLVLDVEEGGDPSALDEALTLLQDAPATPLRDTTRGLALRLRAGPADRPPAERLRDLDAAVDAFTAAAAAPEPSLERLARRRLSLAEALAARHDLTGDPADLDAAESAARRALADAPAGSAELADAQGILGGCLGRRAEQAGGPVAAGLLREALDRLRQAVDGPSPARRSVHGANLRNAMRLVLAQPAADPAVAEHRPERRPHHAPAADPTPASEARNQAAEVAALGSRVVSRVITEEEALRRVRAADFALSGKAVLALLGGAAELIASGSPEEAVPALTLALEASGPRWGRAPGSPWWWVADCYVEAARLSLVQRPDGQLFHRAHDVVREQLRALRASGDTEELAETLFAAGLLHLTPYLGHTSGLSFDSASALWQDRAARQRALRPDDPAHAEGVALPSAAEAAATAVAYLEEARDLSTGHARGRVLKALAEALTVPAGARQPRDEQVLRDERVLRAAREAFDLLDPGRDPLGRLYALRLLNRFGEVALPETLTALLPLPLSVVRERHGDHEASSLFAEALQLATETGRTDLQSRLLDAADRELPLLATDSQRRLRWDRELHCLADNRLGCTTGTLPVARAAADLRSLAEANGWSAAELAATLVHLAAHASVDEGGEARELLAEAQLASPEPLQPHGLALAHLDGMLAHDLGVRAEAQEPESAVRLFATAVLQFARCRQTDLALAAMDAGIRCLHRCEGPSADAAALALMPISVFLQDLTDETVDWKLRDLYQHLAYKLTGPTVDHSVAAALHQAAKGVAFGIATAQPGPLAFPARLDAMLGHVRGGEAQLAEPLPDFEVPGGAGTAMLFYLASAEAEPEQSAEAEVRNLQRAADRWIDLHLRHTRRPTELPLLHLREIQGILPEETVLLSFLLSDFRHPKSGDTVLALHGLSVSREEVMHRTSYFPAYGGGLQQISRGSHTLHVSPAAPRIAALRRALTADPLHRQLSRGAQQLLTEDSRSHLAGFQDQLPGWAAQGKTHLCVWANGPLHYLPFALLGTDDGPLADGWTVTQIPQLSALHRPGPPPGGPPARGLTAFAFDSAGTDSLETHAARVAAAMGAADPVLGPAATARRLLSALPASRYVHVAAHGSHNEWAPWYQCLFLAPDQQHGHDGRVHAHDILRTDLRGVELVTLSACESALGRFDVNDNLRGLPAAFLAAGAAAVVGCLWPVAPDVATDFFGALYEHLAGDPDRRAAFRKAQILTRERHPAYRDWGAFCYLGDWRTPTSDTPRGARA